VPERWELVRVLARSIQPMPFECAVRPGASAIQLSAALGVAVDLIEPVDGS